MGGRRRRRQLDLDFGDRRRWQEFPEEVKEECIELLSLLLGEIVQAEREAADERG